MVPVPPLSRPSRRNLHQQGQVEDRRTATHTKTTIRTRLTWIITARGYQAERVSRQTLKIVNTYLMSPQIPERSRPS